MKIKRLTTDAVMLAMLIICAQITIPLPGIPLTLQTFAIGLIATILPVKDTLLTIFLYLLLGLVGLPVFANFTGGLPILFSPLGGYLIGFLVYGFITSGLLKLFTSTPAITLGANILGAGFQLITGSLGIIFFNHTTFLQALTIGTVPFIIPELLKVVLVTFTAQRLLKIGILVR